MSQIEFTRINNDVNGNPRYVCHFLALVNDNDREMADLLQQTSRPFKFALEHLYTIAVKKANKLGGRKYHNQRKQVINLLNTKYMQEIKSFVVENTWLPRNSFLDFGWGNGYVVIPKDHPWFGKDYMDDCYNDIDINGGLTFSELIDEDETDERYAAYAGEFIIGFDTAHSFDNLEIWPKEEVENETERLRQQVIAAYQPVNT